ncbi:MAG: antitoxin [Spirochaetia bacterium]|jgi:hypothetical protein
MMRTRESFLTLIAELDNDFLELGLVMDQNRKAWDRIQAGATDPLDWAALGFTLHSAYGVLENYFLRVSKFFENSLEPQEWHKALVEKMVLEIPGVRPAVLPDETVKEMAIDLLKFRHRFRNMYGSKLDPEKTAHANQNANLLVAAFSRCHAAFVAKLAAIAKGLK